MAKKKATKPRPPSAAQIAQKKFEQRQLAAERLADAACVKFGLLPTAAVVYPPNLLPERFGRARVPSEYEMASVVAREDMVLLDGVPFLPGAAATVQRIRWEHQINKLTLVATFDVVAMRGELRQTVDVTLASYEVRIDGGTPLIAATHIVREV